MRMGLHTGEPSVGEEGYIGLDVVRAARICSAGHGGQILVSETTRALLGNQLPEGVSVHDLGEAHLKDIQHEHVYQLSVDGGPSEFPPLKTAAEPEIESWGAALSRQIQEQVRRDIERSFAEGLPGAATEEEVPLLQASSISRGVDDPRDLLRRTAEHAADFLETLDERPVFPRSRSRSCARELGGPLPDGPTDPRGRRRARRRGRAGRRRDSGRPLLRLRDRRRGSGGARGGLAHVGVGSERRPLRRRAIRIGGRGGRRRVAKGAARLPRDASFAFVTGCQMANFTALAVARRHVLDEAGWDVDADGLTGAPRDPRSVRREGHVHGHARAAAARARRAGARRGGRPGQHGRRALSRALRDATGPTIVCAQAGEVNTGAFDPLPRSRPPRVRPGRGSTSTAPSVSGRPRARRSRTSSRARSWPTPGRPTRTSG